jgi:hypothetical protein
MTIIRTLTLPLLVRVEEDGDAAHCTVETDNEARPLRFEVRDLSGTPDGESIDERIQRAAAGNVREALARGVAVIEAELRGCACSEIMEKDHARHFKGCELRGGADPTPLPILLHCPMCAAKHIDSGVWATKSHKDHACQRCGHTWRPMTVPTVGVRFLPGYKNDDDEPEDHVNRALSPLSLLFAAIDAAEIIARRLRGKA